MAKKSSEFGGQVGRIQPLPHPLAVDEEARLMRAIDPDPPRTLAGVPIEAKVNSVEEQRVVDAGKRGIGPVDRQGDLS